MIKKRRSKHKHNHYCLLLNKNAARFERQVVERLTAAIRHIGGFYTIIEPETAAELLRMAEQAAGTRKRSGYVARSIGKRGPITALIACGGDGTFNLVARPAMAADLPVGILPMGSLNNIARSINGGIDSANAIKKIISGSYRQIDSARVATQTFFGSVGLGFTTALSRYLDSGKIPRFGIGWSQLAARAAADVPPIRTILKVDSFRFEISPILLNINLLPYSAGLQLSPASIPNDSLAEIVFDSGNKIGEFGTFARLIHKKKYLYGDDIRLYRGTTVACQPTQGRHLYLDGELIEMPTNVLEIQIGQHHVKVLC